MCAFISSKEISLNKSVMLHACAGEIIFFCLVMEWHSARRHFQEVIIWCHGQIRGFFFLQAWEYIIKMHCIPGRLVTNDLTDISFLTFGSWKYFVHIVQKKRVDIVVLVLIFPPQCGAACSCPAHVHRRLSHPGHFEGGKRGIPPRLYSHKSHLLLLNYLAMLLVQTHDFKQWLRRL